MFHQPINLENSERSARFGKDSPPFFATFFAKGNKSRPPYLIFTLLPQKMDITLGTVVSQNLSLISGNNHLGPNN